MDDPIGSSVPKRHIQGTQCQLGFQMGHAYLTTGLEKAAMTTAIPDQVSI